MAYKDKHGFISGIEIKSKDESGWVNNYKFKWSPNSRNEGVLTETTTGSYRFISVGDDKNAYDLKTSYVKKLINDNFDLNTGSFKQVSKPKTIKTKNDNFNNAITLPSRGTGSTKTGKTKKDV